MPLKRGAVLTPKQSRFVEEYLVDLNARQAAIRAGYSVKTATEIGYENLRNPRIAEALATARQALSERTAITADRVVAELAKIGFSNMADYMKATPAGDPYLDFSRLTRDQAAALQEVTVEDYVNGRGEHARDVKRVRFKLADKQAALVSLGRHLGIFDDKVTLTLEHRISLMTPEERRARLIELRAKAAEVIDGEATEVKEDRVRVLRSSTADR